MCCSLVLAGCCLLFAVCRPSSVVFCCWFSVGVIAVYGLLCFVVCALCVLCVECLWVVCLVPCALIAYVRVVVGCLMFVVSVWDRCWFAV